MAHTALKQPSIDVYPISAWSVINRGVKALYVNPDWGINLVDGVSLDVEDDEQGNFVGLGIYDPKLNVCYYWSALDLIPPWFEIPKFIAHNGVSDLRKLQKWGFKIDDSWLLFDTQLAAHVLDSSKRQFGLKALVKEIFNAEYPSYDSIVGKRTEKQSKPRITLDKQPVELVSEYNAADCYWTYELYKHQLPLINKLDNNVYSKLSTINYLNQLELPASFVFDAISQTGVRIDLSYLKTLEASLEAQREAVKGPILNELGPINLNSPKQLLEALKAKDICPILKGKPSTDKRAIEPLKERYPIIASLLRFSELETLLSSFVYPYLERGQEIVKPQFRQTGTRTGRPSCSNPNLLQIPKRTENGKLVRKMFIAREGHLLGDTDFGQIEPRLLAHLSQDEALLRLFNDGVDFHTYTGERLGISRDRAKILNLAVGYKATFKSVSQQLKCSWEQAQREIDKWWSAFPGLYDWEQKLIYESRKTGYCTTLMGRRIKVDDLSNSNQWRREGAERQLINNITQGSAAEVMKMSMINVYKSGFTILCQVYDELLCELKEESASSDIEIIVDKMQSTVKLSIPLTVESGLGKSWAECK